MSTHFTIVSLGKKTCTAFIAFRARLLAYNVHNLDTHCNEFGRLGTEREGLQLKLRVDN